MLEDTPGSPSLAGAVVCCTFAAGAVVQATTPRWPVRSSLGMGAVGVGAGAVVLAAWLPKPNLALFVAGTMFAGDGAGAIFRGALGTVVEIAEADARAEALAGMFLAAYVGLAIPVIGAGIALELISARTTILGFATFVLLGMATTARWLLARPPARPPAASLARAESAPVSR